WWTAFVQLPVRRREGLLSGYLDNLPPWEMILNALEREVTRTAAGRNQQVNSNAPHATTQKRRQRRHNLPDHGQGFSWVRCLINGKEELFEFTAAQSHVVAKLWLDWEAGGTGVRGETLQEGTLKVSTCESNMKTLFKRHRAWNTLIVSYRKGVYCL